MLICHVPIRTYLLGESCAFILKNISSFHRSNSSSDYGESNQTNLEEEKNFGADHFMKKKGRNNEGYILLDIAGRRASQKSTIENILVQEPLKSEENHLIKQLIILYVLETN